MLVSNVALPIYFQKYENTQQIGKLCCIFQFGRSYQCSILNQYQFNFI